MRHPLVMVGGLTQTSDGTKVTIPIFNLGNSTPVTVSSQSITINSTVHHVIGPGAVIQNIYGGEPGDLLLLLSPESKWLAGGDNILGGVHPLSSDQVTSFVFLNGNWIPW